MGNAPRETEMRVGRERVCTAQGHRPCPVPCARGLSLERGRHCRAGRWKQGSPRENILIDLLTLASFPYSRSFISSLSASLCPVPLAPCSAPPTPPHPAEHRGRHRCIPVTRLSWSFHKQRALGFGCRRALLTPSGSHHFCVSATAEALRVDRTALVP